MARRYLCNVTILLIAVFSLQVTQSSPTANRHKRHSDSLFTSELSKVRGTAVARSFLNSILGAQSSSSSSSSGKVKRHLSGAEDMTHPGSPITLQNVRELHSALQFNEGSEENELSLRNRDVLTMLSKLLRLRSSMEQPCMRWFYNYILTMSIFSGDIHLPMAALMDHHTCTVIRQLVTDLKLQAFLRTDNNQRHRRADRRPAEETEIM